MLTLKLKVKKFLFGYRKVKTKILKLFIIVKEINKFKKLKYIESFEVNLNETRLRGKQNEKN